ncbi:MAG: HD domain-containing phosphohydrolase [bacterium]
MQIISVDEISFNKILPFNLYDDNGEIIFGAGEILTPGKLLQLRSLHLIYRDEFSDDDNIESSDYSSTEEISDEEEEERKLPVPVQPNILVKKVISHAISQKKQEAIKDLFKIILLSPKENIKQSTSLCLELRDKLMDEVLSSADDIIYRSQLKMHGDFNITHGVNVSTLAILLGYKLKLNEQQIKDVALGGMLHDIGKTRIPKSSELDKNAQAKDAKMMQLHPQVGYKIIKNEMGLNEVIAKIALEHHEKNDGTGYPYGISGELINIYTQIISVCNAYDVLTSKKGHVKVKNSKEAIKIMLEEGSRSFNPHVLYTFVHMANYNDPEEYAS